MSLIQIEFEKKLFELGLPYRRNDDDFYSISCHNGVGNHIKVQLVSSLPPVKQIHCSKNGVDVQAIGLFKFKFPLSDIEPELFIFTIPNSIKNQADYLVIPTGELCKRLARKNPRTVYRQRVEMVFWVMQNGFAYDTTHISPEAEWYFMGKGLNGRMADGTEIDYSEYLNIWQRLIVQ